MFPDGNFQYYHNTLQYNSISKAFCFCKTQQYDFVLEELKKARYHAEEMTKINHQQKEYERSIVRTPFAFMRLRKPALWKTPLGEPFLLPFPQLLALLLLLQLAQAQLFILLCLVFEIDLLFNKDGKGDKREPQS